MVTPTRQQTRIQARLELAEKPLPRKVRILRCSGSLVATGHSSAVVLLGSTEPVVSAERPAALDPVETLAESGSARLDILGDTGSFRFFGYVDSIRDTYEMGLWRGLRLTLLSPTALLDQGPECHNGDDWRGLGLRKFVESVIARGRADAPQGLMPVHYGNLPHVGAGDPVQFLESKYELVSRILGNHGFWFTTDGEQIRVGSSSEVGDAVTLHVGGDGAQLESFVREKRFRPGAFTISSHREGDASAISQPQPSRPPAPSDVVLKNAMARSDALYNTARSERCSAAIRTGVDLEGQSARVVRRWQSGLVGCSGKTRHPLLKPGAQLAVEGVGKQSGPYFVDSVDFVWIAGGEFVADFAGTLLSAAHPPLLDPPRDRGPFNALVAGHSDERPGQVQVEYSSFIDTSTGKNLSRWVRCAARQAGVAGGELMLPEKGSWVEVGHVEGLAKQPIIGSGGALFGDRGSDVFQTASAAELRGNHVKSYRSRGGSMLVFRDTPDKECMEIAARRIAISSDSDLELRAAAKLVLWADQLVLRAGGIEITAEDLLKLIASSIKMKRYAGA